jgi:hypothetical protein
MTRRESSFGDGSCEALALSRRHRTIQFPALRAGTGAHTLVAKHVWLATTAADIQRSARFFDEVNVRATHSRKFQHTERPCRPRARGSCVPLR